jgi:hypothetical protein
MMDQFFGKQRIMRKGDTMNRRRSLTMLSGAAIGGIAGRGKARVVEAQERSPSGTQGEISPEKLLLKDYRPKSIYRIPETRITKAKYPVIDCHTHPYARTSSQVDQWVRNMDAVGLEKNVILTMASGDSFNDIHRRFSQHPDVSSFGAGSISLSSVRLDSRRARWRCWNAAMTRGRRGLGSSWTKGAALALP